MKKSLLSQTNRFAFSRSTSRVSRFAIALAVASLTTLGSVGGRSQYQPVLIDPVTSLVPGQPLTCNLETTGGPTSVTVYSSPAGAVSYQGTVGASSTVSLSTNPNIPATQVTMYLVTDGQETRSAVVNVDDSPVSSGLATITQR